MHFNSYGENWKHVLSWSNDELYLDGVGSAHNRATHTLVMELKINSSSPPPLLPSNGSNTYYKIPNSLPLVIFMIHYNTVVDFQSTFHRFQILVAEVDRW